MGNGPRLTFDFETSGDLKVSDESNTLTEQDLIDLTNKVQSKMGSANQIFLSPQSFIIEVNPEYRGTPWVSMARMTRREHAVAGLHTTLFKLGLFKRLSEDNIEEIKHKTIKRLKKAKWAHYQQSNKMGQP